MSVKFHQRRTQCTTQDFLLGGGPAADIFDNKLFLGLASENRLLANNVDLCKYSLIFSELFINLIGIV